MNLIEKLKKNERPFGLCTKEEQECFRKVGKKNCQFFNGGWQKSIYDTFEPGSVYRIKKTYTPEAEIEKCERYYDEHGLACFKLAGKTELCIHTAVSHKNFAGFEYEDEKVSPHPYIAILQHDMTYKINPPKYVLMRK